MFYVILNTCGTFAWHCKNDLLLQSLKVLNVIYSAAVTAVFKMEDGSYKRFTRAVEGTSSGYRINHEVSVQYYTNKF